MLAGTQPGRGGEGKSVVTWHARILELRKLGLLVLLSVLASTAHASDPRPGEIVGQLELGAPNVPEFILRGTLPLPRGIYPRDDDRTPLCVIDTDGSLVPAQLETVSRYARNDEGADVVELIARVHRGRDVATGERVRYSIVYAPSARPAYSGQAEVDALLAMPDGVLLRARDVFGNLYRTDLFEDVRAGRGQRSRTLRQGSFALQDATHQTLSAAPAVAGAHGTLPHFMGVHSYFTRWAGEPFFSLDLRVHNAMSGFSPTDPGDDALGALYFTSLELRLPRDWLVFNAFDDPFWGTPYDEGQFRIWPIIAPLAGGRQHVLPSMAQLERRLVIVKPGEQARALCVQREKNLGFARAGTNGQGHEYWSWWNPATGRYFPQHVRLPELDHLGLDTLRAEDEAQLLMRADQVAHGTAGQWPATSAGLGWAHPWGIEDGGMVSGSEINILEGVTTAAAASSEGYRLHELEHRMLTDRQHNVLFNRDGSPAALEQWLVPYPGGHFNPVWWYNAPMLWANDPFGFGEAPTFQIEYVQAHGLAAPYEAALEAFDSIDEAHLIRYTRNAKVLVWLGNDALAKDDLRAQAEGVHFAYNEYPMDPSGYAIVSGLRAEQNYVAEHPGWGFPFSRAEGWGIDVMNAAYCTQDDDFRRKLAPWYEHILDLVEAGQSTCTGVLQSTSFGNVFNAQYRCRQSIEAAIEENALMGVRECVFGREDPERFLRLNQVLAKSFYAMISPGIWDPLDHGPGAMLALGPFDNDQPPFCGPVPTDGTYGFADKYQCWPSFGYAWEITGDDVFLDKAREALGGTLLPALLGAGLDNLANRASLLALAQRLP